MKGKDFVSIRDLTGDDIWRLIHRAMELKRVPQQPLLSGKTLALLFEKPSLRTRVSFDVAMYQLGGRALYLSPAEVGLGSREPVEDVARVLSRYVDGIVVRTLDQSVVERLAEYASVPVINGLSDAEHPCQAIADLLTIYEKKGALKGLTIAYVGDGNNVASSLLMAAVLVGANFHFAGPLGYYPPDWALSYAWDVGLNGGGRLLTTNDPRAVMEGADVVYTDVWTSMGQEAEAERRQRVFANYQVNMELLAHAKADAIVMHDLPAHRGQEITAEVIDCPQSVIFDQAENRLHAQKAILLELLGK